MKSTNGFTSEQNTIINYNIQKGDILLIQAFAGTGKTTTLLNLAKKHSSKKILYITFNKSLSDNTKKLIQYDTLEVCTMHSLALKHVDPDNTFTIGKLSLSFIEDIFKIDRHESTIVKNILHNFFSSHASVISECHTNSMNLLDTSKYIDLSKNLWNLILMKKCKIPHDAYLKMFQLQYTIFDYDLIMLDEAQDATECMLSILKRQNNAVRVLVGDIHQQIYGFRNVCNPFNEQKTNKIKHFSLSQSFRYGYEISHLSNMFLNYFKNEKKKIRSVQLFTNICTNINDLKIEKYTIISRTNLHILKEAFSLNDNTTCYILGKSINFDKEILYVENINNIIIGNQHLNINKLQHFDTIESLKRYYIELGNFKWTTRIALYIEYGYDSLLVNYQKLKNITSCIIIQ